MTPCPPTFSRPAKDRTGIELTVRATVDPAGGGSDRRAQADFFRAGGGANFSRLIVVATRVGAGMRLRHGHGNLRSEADYLGPPRLRSEFFSIQFNQILDR